MTESFLISLFAFGALVMSLIGVYLLVRILRPQVFEIPAPPPPVVNTVPAEPILTEPVPTAPVLTEPQIQTSGDIQVSDQKHPAELMMEIADEARAAMPAPTEQAPFVPAQELPVAAQTVQPLPSPNLPPPVALAPQGLVERAPILDTQNPIVEPPPPVDVMIPEKVSVTDIGESKSVSGVRYSGNPANRMLRYKRRNRNAK